MKLWEALKALDEGKRIARTCMQGAYWELSEALADGMGFSADDFSATDWEVVEPAYMSFTKMITYLYDGKRFRRKAWPSTAHCIELCGDHIFLITDFTKKSFSPTMKDLLSTDWYEVKKEDEE